MRRVSPFALAATLTVAVVSPLASQPVEDLLRTPIADAERTRVFVLGTQHLRRIDDLDPATLEPLLEVLEAWAPEAMGIEELPPRVIAAMEDDPAYAPVLERFSGERHRHGRLLQKRLAVSWQRALAEADSLLQALGREAGNPVALRSDLVLRLVAGYEAESAALHYAMLREREASAIPDTIRAWLDALLDSPNESVRIGVALAGRLGHDRVHPIDDHLDKDLFLSFAAELSEEIETTGAYRELVESGALEASLDAARRAHDNGDLLPFYRELNAPPSLARDLGQWELFFRTRLDSGLDRARVALWEVRNLATAAHVRRTTATIPGGRALVVVGASHKPFLDAYLARMMDVEVVEAAEVIGAPPR